MAAKVSSFDSHRSNYALIPYTPNCFSDGYSEIHVDLYWDSADTSCLLVAYAPDCYPASLTADSWFEAAGLVPELLRTCFGADEIDERFTTQGARIVQYFTTRVLGFNNN